jgi:hypothetical protein
MREKERAASWGGIYSIFTTDDPSSPRAPPLQRELARKAASADPIELELVATAAYLAAEGNSRPWAETANRKPEKAADHLEGAKVLYRKLKQMKTPRPLPAIA